MNRENIIKELSRLLSGIDLHPLFMKDFTDLIVGSGIEARVFKQLVRLLHILNCFGVDATKHLEFEKLRSGLFSMHIDGDTFNLRVLYSILPNGAPSLLLCFYERGGKKATDYSGYIDPAMDRFRERLEVYERGEY